QDTGDPNLPGVQVTLVWGGFNSDTIGNGNDITIGTVTTTNPALASQPNYLFGNLPSGNYSVQVSATGGSGGVPANVNLTDSINDAVLDPNAQPQVFLNIGQNLLNVDFGYQGNATIGDTVWYDVNGNGIRENGPSIFEPGIANAVVTVTFAGADGLFPGDAGDTGDQIVFTTTTNASGTYQLTGLPANLPNSPYRVTVTPPAGFTVQTFDNDDPLNGPFITPNQSALTLAPGQTNLLQDFGYRGTASIGDFVWNDLNGDGIQQGGEPGLDGVQVSLLQAGLDGVFNTLDDQVIAQTTTAGGGAYSFNGLVAGNYQLAFGNTDGTLTYQRSPQNTIAVGATPANDSDASATTGRTNTITLADGEINGTIDAGLFLGTSVGNSIFNDLNNNGLQDVGEVGINEVEVILYDAAGTTALQTTTTNAQGLYLFSGLAAGSYVIEVSAPNFNAGNVLENFTSSTGLNGSLTGPFEPGANANTSNVDGDDNGTIVGTLGAGGVIRTVAVVLDNTEPTGENPNNDPTTPDNQSNLAADMGVFLPSTIGNTIFNDLNNNGLLDVSEVGIDNVEVVLLDGTGTPLVTTTTAGGGLYSFSNLGAGNYQVQISATNFNVGNPLAGFQSSTTTSTTPNDGIDNDDNGVVVGTLGTGGVVQTNPFAVTPGTTNNTLDFGLFGALSIGNLVFDDVNNNGVQDVGENGISGVEVVLLNGTGTGIATTTTDANGQYLFTGLAPAEYRVRLSAANFNLAGALVGYRSSTGAANAFEGAGTPVPGTSNVDNDDNGTTTGTLGSGGFIETPTFLLQGVQPTGETPNNDPTTPDDRSNLAVDFGVYRTQSLGNAIFNDLNNNGIQDVGELGINEVEVILYDAAGTTALQTTTTNAQGLYLFSGLAAGSYVIEISAPNFNVGNPLAGFTSSTGLNGSLTGPFEPGANANTSNVDGDDNGTITGTLGAGGVIRTVAVVLDNTEPTGENPNNDPTTPDNQSNLAADMGVFLPSTIGNTIFNDLNNNGLLDVGEVGIDNVEVVLLDGTGTPLVTTTTAGGGLYSFSNLGAGNYQVQISATNFNVGNPLAGFQSSTPTSTTPNDGIDNDDNGVVVGTLGTGGVVQTNPFAVTPGTTNNTLDFGLFQGASIGNEVFIDTNNNGIRDVGEVGRPGVIIRLLDITGVNEIANTTTDVNGQYLFTGLAPANYIVEVAAANFTAGGQLFQFVSSTGNPGFAAPTPFEGASTPNPSANTTDQDDNGTTIGGVVRTTLVDLTVAQPIGEIPNNDPLTPDAFSNLTVDFAFYQTTTITGTVWVDRTPNGILEPTEPGRLGGVTITATGPTGTFTTTTLPDGTYVFTNIPAGTYTITQTQPAGYGSSTPNTVVVNAPPNGNAVVNFGETLSSVSGRVFFDRNNNGLQDPGDAGIPNVVMNLVGTDANGAPVNLNTTTDANGDYIFRELVGGTYVINETQPTTPPNIDGIDTPGTAGGIANTLANPNQISNIVLPGGIDATGYNFAEIPLTSIAGSVYEDQNGNGVRDFLEPGIQLATITLTGTTVQGNPVNIQVQTDANGNYLFDNVVPGTYTLTETQPAGFLDWLEQNGTPPATVVLNDQFQNINLITNTGPATGFNFGEVLPVSIFGSVYVDLNANGVLDGGDGPINGVVITLTGITDLGTTITQVTTTLPNGTYSFTGLRPGTYTIRETQPTNFGDSNETVGDRGGIISANDVISNIVLRSGQVATGYNFGESDQINLVLTQTIDRRLVNVGEFVTITYNVLNQGPATGNNVVMSAPLPPGLQFASTSAPGSYNPLTGQWNIGTLPAGQMVTMQVQARVLQSGVLTNFAQVTASNREVTLVDNFSNVNVISAYRALALSKRTFLTSVTPASGAAPTGTTAARFVLRRR
ncbi:MAG: SdrD B-like domain-containing protein, partial [Zavarzinella sp.]